METETDRAAELVDQLTSKDPSARNVAYNQLKHDRDTIIRGLMKIARNGGQTPRSRDARLRAIQLLGRYRASEAAQFLTENIEYTSSFAVVREIHPLNGYPAAEALVQIGRPSIDAIVARLSRPVSDAELCLFAFVIEWIDGEEVGLYRLKLVLENDRKRGFVDREENITRLIRLYESTNFSDPKQWPAHKLK